MKKSLLIFILLIAAPSYSAAQDCKVKFSVVFTDGKVLKVGLTAEQKKLWDRDGAKKYKGICLDPAKPDYVILWTEGISGGEAVDGAVDQVNRGRSTGQSTTMQLGSPRYDSPGNSPGWISSDMVLVPSGVVRGKADYAILDVSKNPAQTVHKGMGYQDVPAETINQPGQATDEADFASTIADPSDALEKALKWIKKDRKI
jgi:hypothetical protein